MPGILLTFLKSFIPPLPTVVIVGANAAIYGFWLGFLYSWIGIVSGCVVTFLLIRQLAGHRIMKRWAAKPKVAKAVSWIQQHAFWYIFIFSLFPLGPFVVVNLASGLARVPFRAYLLAIVTGKAGMVFMVSLIGHDLDRYRQQPILLLIVVGFLIISIMILKKVESRFNRRARPE